MRLAVFRFGADGMTSETGYRWDPAPILFCSEENTCVYGKENRRRTIGRDVLHTNIDFTLTKEEISQVEKAKYNQGRPVRFSSAFNTSLITVLSRAGQPCSYR
ncbi:hypothetical protein ACEQPO_05205 [Bacillus sp. SL00103]